MLTRSIVAAVLLVTQPAVSQEPAASRPKPTWAVEYAEKFCALVRMPDGGSPGIIIRERPLSDYAQLMILTPLKSRSRAEYGNLRFNFADGTGKTSTMQMADLPDRGVRVIETWLPEEQMAQVQLDGSIHVVADGKFDLTIPLPAIAKAKRALDTCSNDLLKRWNIERTWAVNAKDVPDVRSLFSSDDYPSDLRENNKQGTIVALMKVDANGRVQSCKANEVEGDPRFEAVTCKILLKRARYRPATNAAGQTVESYVLSPAVRWVLGY